MRFLSIIELGLYSSYIYVDMGLIMSYIQKDRVQERFQAVCREFCDPGNVSFGVEKETDPRGLSLGGDREDLGATAVGDCRLSAL